MHLLHLSLADIRADALLRDRLALDPADLAALETSIATEGLRQPVEVFAPDRADGPPYALISGLRRLTAMRNLDARHPGGRFARIPAFLRQPETLAGALAAMVSENEIRAAISPWEKGTLALRCVEEGLFANLDTAIDALFPALTRQARSRLRGFALVVETLDGALSDPCTLSAARMDRLAAACRAGLSDLLRAVLADLPGAAPDRQWHALTPALSEALMAEPDFPRPGRPRRLLHLKSGVTLRREPCRGGWILRITGKDARHPGIVDDILDHVEEWFG